MYITGFEVTSVGTEILLSVCGRIKDMDGSEHYMNWWECSHSTEWS